MTTASARIATIAAIGTLLVACSAPPEPSGDDASRDDDDRGRTAVGPTAALAPGTHEFTTTDGNTMPYEIAGNPVASTTVLFVHGWMCERRFWDDQTHAIADTYRTIVVDLPGHGRASTNRERWTVAQYAEDVAGLLEALDLRDTVLVGHSMGGPVALRAAKLAEGRLRGVVAVDSLHNAEYSFSGERADAIVKAIAADYPTYCERMAQQLFPEPDAELTLRRVVAAGCRPEQAAIGVGLMRDFLTIDLAPWFREAGVPIRAINAAGGRPTEIEINRGYADFDAVLMDDVGHYLHMTRPQEFNALLVATLDELAPAGG